ncbi:MAG: VWA domain-containing protein [Burkholderiaceae bacterium]|nr:VWA domain-containing protein [Burkholderiaceae bacterium]
MAAAALDAPYDRLAALPRALWLPGLTCSAGLPGADCTGQRLADLQRWRLALAEGMLPPPDADFGDRQALAPLRQAIGALDLPAACRGAEAMAEQLLRTLLWHLDRIVDLQPRLSRAQAIAQVTEEFSAAWTLLKGDWDELLALLQQLGEGHHLRWDELRGLLSRREWAEARRIGETLKSVPELVALIRRLGRAERAARPQALPPRADDSAARRLLGLEAVETRLPGAPGELRGIRLSDRIEGMLGSEAAMLLHPVLHKLWRARRAEARLLTYDSEAVLVDWRPDPAAPPRQDPRPPEPEALERGPIIVCIDTSGSMRGAPETLAKAVVLQALRTAHQERRGCRLIAFGGPDEIIERDLAGRGGLAALLDLIGQGFDGGTDVQGPIERAIERVHEARWASADLLIVSDGEFGCTPATLAQLDDARDRLGLRVQGVLVGDRETMGLMEVSDDIFWVRDWRRHGGGPVKAGSFSPVHSKSLTALYFPGALSARAARHRPAS